MRILTVIAEMGSGGAEAVAATLSTAAVADGDTVALASSGGWRIADLAAAGVRPVPVRLRTRSPLGVLRSAAALRRELDASPPDLVHSHNVKAAVTAGLAGVRRRKLAHLVTLHGVRDEEYPSAAKALARCADRVVAVSEHVGRRLVQEGMPAERVDVVENAVAAMPRHPRAEARARIGLPTDAVVAICVARLVPQKRHDLLLQAWRRLPGNAVLLVVGDGPRRSELAALAAEHAAGEVRLLGDRDDVDWLLAAADVCVLPTDWEGLPISLLEAMTVGVPIVASAVGGIADSLAGAVCAVAPGSAASLADGLREVLDDPLRRQALGAAGERLIAQRFSTDSMIAGYRHVQHRLLGTPAA